MNTHMQLIWKSVFAPRAAVDLARAHPNPTTLGWIYVFVAALVTVAVDQAMRALIRPFTGYAGEPDAGILSALDTPIANGLLTLFYFVLLYAFGRWFWVAMIGPPTKQSDVDAALVVTFAVTIALTVPQYFFFEAAQAAPLPVQSLGWAAFVGLVLVLCTVYFQHALGISSTRSFWLNVLLFVITFVFVAVLMLVAIFLWTIFSGTPIDQIFPVDEVSQ